MSYERLQEWSQQGILAKPLELARAMGLNVVRHHQKQLDILENQMDITI
ncbi:hypothetical protein AAC978_14375 [Desulfitobacterium sp. THU1]